MDKAGARDEKFMRYAMAAHGSSVYLVALAQTRSEHDAQDVAQDVFCRLLTDATAFTSDEHLRARDGAHAPAPGAQADEADS